MVVGLGVTIWMVEEVKDNMNIGLLLVTFI